VEKFIEKKKNGYNMEDSGPYRVIIHTAVVTRHDLIA
jgi:hypothetical protein